MAMTLYDPQTLGFFS